MTTENVTIIGAGPAGIAAAIQLTRWGVKPVIVEKHHIGGLLVNANLVENYPGFPEGISGFELVKLFTSQMERIGVTVSFEEVTEIDYDTDFIISTSKRDFASKMVVVASGTRPKPFDAIEIPQGLSNRVFSEIHSLTSLNDKQITIVGAGDAAFDYALNLSQRNSVTILNRSANTKCLPLLWERSQNSSNITYIENTRISGMKQSQEGITISCQNTHRDWELEADYVIFSIGREPQREFLSSRFEEYSPDLERDGRLYFVGDVKNDIYRQTSIAVGDGVRAAMRICQILKETGQCKS